MKQQNAHTHTHTQWSYWRRRGGAPGRSFLLFIAPSGTGPGSSRLRPTQTAATTQLRHSAISAATVCLCVCVLSTHTLLCEVSEPDCSFSNKLRLAAESLSHGLETHTHTHKPTCSQSCGSTLDLLNQGPPSRVLQRRSS